MRAALCMVLCFAASAAADPVYKWVDKDGEEHFTNDISTIPSGQKTEVIKGDGVDFISAHASSATGEPPATPARAVVNHANEPPAQPAQSDRQRDESVWRQRFRSVHAQIEELTARVAKDQERLDAVKDVEVSVNSNRAYGQSADFPAERARRELKVDTAALREAKDELEELERSASRQAVPRAWRE